MQRRSISFAIQTGETLALVGESGSGKSTVGKTIQQLVEPVSGSIRFKGHDLFSSPAAERKRFRREIQYIFQDPYGSLNPRKRVGESIIEPALAHRLLEPGAAAETRIADLLEKVGLPARYATRYPHEFSGGQRQRICIARALACDPSLIIADEAVSALDVSVQAQVINLFMRLQADTGLAYLFITHDMAVVERISHRVAVMYLGQLVEIGTRRQIFETPQHHYTKRLLAAVPVINPGNRRKPPPLDGEIPSPVRRVGDRTRDPCANTTEIETGHFVATPEEAAVTGHHGLRAQRLRRAIPLQNTKLNRRGKMSRFFESVRQEKVSQSKRFVRDDGDRRSPWLPYRRPMRIGAGRRKPDRGAAARPVRTSTPSTPFLIVLGLGRQQHLRWPGAARPRTLELQPGLATVLGVPWMTTRASGSRCARA